MYEPQQSALGRSLATPPTLSGPEDLEAGCSLAAGLAEVWLLGSEWRKSTGIAIAVQCACAQTVLAGTPGTQVPHL